MNTDMKDILFANLRSLQIRYDNLETALSESNKGYDLIMTYVDDEDTKTDFANSMEIALMVLEQTTYSVFIDLLIANMELNIKDEQSAFISIKNDIGILKKMKEYIENTSNLLKELI